MQFVSHLATPAGSKAESIPRRKGECGSGGGQGLQNCSISRRPGLLSARDVLDPAHRAVSGRLWATPPSCAMESGRDREIGGIFSFLFVSTRLCGWKEGKRKLIGVDVVEFL